MPELPEVETVCRTLRRHTVGRKIEQVHVVQPRLRWPVDIPTLTKTLTGATITGVRRRAKYILIDMQPAGDGPQAVVAIHLGMSGIVRVVAQDVPMRKHDHVVIALMGGREMRFNDPRRFGSVHCFDAQQEATHPRFLGLGMEPLDAHTFDGHRLYALAKKSSRALKTFIMDAKVVVGVGNIYASEALNRCGLSPRKAAHRLTKAHAHALVDAIVTTLEDAISQGGTTLRDFSDADAQVGHFAHRLRVYNRAGMPCACGQGTILRIVQDNRSTFYCRSCQRL
jgi:formamidopyrimidine-DNA glycosylase